MPPPPFGAAQAFLSFVSSFSQIRSKHRRPLHHLLPIPHRAAIHLVASHLLPPPPSPTFPFRPSFPDPEGARIGSGAATLHVVASLARHLVSQASKEEIAEFLPEATGSSASVVCFMATKHVLLLHAGGDSKRVPLVNPMGKAFLPVPYLAGATPTGLSRCSSTTSGVQRKAIIQDRHRQVQPALPLHLQ